MSMSGTKSMKLAIRIMIILLAALLLALAVAVAGCRRSPEPQNEDDRSTASPATTLSSYFPLTKGSTWRYLGEGMEYASFTREVLFARDRRGQLREDNGGTIIAAVYEIADDAIIRIYNAGEAYDDENRLDITTPESEQTAILRTPLQTGTTWQTPGNETRTITATDAVVETPAGTFENCIVVKIESAGDYSTLHEYFKEGIGLVLREFESEGYRVISTLEEYSIK